LVIDLLQEIQAIIQREAAMLTAAAIGDLKRSFRGALLEPTVCSDKIRISDPTSEAAVHVENKMWR
jgi:hypothetical protein